jgi:NAD-dependent deacetylase
MKIVVLTGAGISKDSGISMYRDLDGLWSKYNQAEVCSSKAMFHTPEKVISFHNELRKTFIGKKPNAAHLALAKLEKHHEVTIVTQNIDNLHELAGSSRVLHVHGEINKARNMETGEVMQVSSDLDPHGIYRYDTVLFGEWPMDSEALDAMYVCDLFIVIGTSGYVFPAAGYIDRVNMVGKSDTIEINVVDTPITHKFNRVIRGTASKTVPKLVRELARAK